MTSNMCVVRESILKTHTFFPYTVWALGTKPGVFLPQWGKRDLTLMGKRRVLLKEGDLTIMGKQGDGKKKGILPLWRKEKVSLSLRKEEGDLT